MAFIICGIRYGDSLYVVYSIERDNDSDNVFVSKLVNCSSGFAMDDNFVMGEKEAFDKVLESFFGKVSVDVLSENKVSIMKNVVLEGINKFDIDKCYVTTVSKGDVRDIMINYGIVSWDSQKVVVKEKKSSWLRKGDISSIILILFGIIVLIASIWVVVKVL